MLGFPRELEGKSVNNTCGLRDPQVRTDFSIQTCGSLSRSEQGSVGLHRLRAGTGGRLVVLRDFARGLREDVHVELGANHAQVLAVVGHVVELEPAWVAAGHVLSVEVARVHLVAELIAPLALERHRVQRRTSA